MKKEIKILFLLSTISILITACGINSSTQNTNHKNSSTTSQNKEKEDAKTPIVLTGTWTSENTDGSYQEAIITNDSIEINWVSDNGATKSIYWSGTYIAPTEFTEEYSWISDRNKEKTDSSLLASTDDTKEFIYKDGKINYEVTLMGTTSTFELSQTSKEIPDTQQVSEPSYKITYQNAYIYQNNVAGLCLQAIVEVENTGDNNLLLDFSSYEVTGEDGTLLHTTSSSFIPYPRIIEPGEKGYFYEEQPIDSQTPTSGLTITPHINAQIASDTENPRFETSDIKIYDKDRGSIDIHGKVKNTTSSSHSQICIAAILFNENNEPIGQLTSWITNSLQPNEEVGFELEPAFLPNEITSASISNYKIFAFSYQ